MVSSKGLGEGRLISKLISAVVGGIQFFGNHWPEGPFLIELWSEAPWFLVIWPIP